MRTLLLPLALALAATLSLPAAASSHREVRVKGGQDSVAVKRQPAAAPAAATSQKEIADQSTRPQPVRK